MRPIRYAKSVRLWRRPGTEGFTLTLAVLLTIIVLILGLAMIEASRIELTLAARDSQRIMAVNAAEMGVEVGMAMATSQISPWAIMRKNGSALTWELPTASEVPLYGTNHICRLFTDVAVGNGVDAVYTVVVEDMWGSIYTSGVYRIHGYGVSGPFTRHVTQDAQCVTYASFGWLTNSENGVYFRTGDRVEGWMYTNDSLYIAGGPIFAGQVNSAEDPGVVKASGYTYAPQFLAPPNKIIAPSPVVPMGNLVNTNQITLIQTKAGQATGVTLPANGGKPYRAIFKIDGTVAIQPAKVAAPVAESDWGTVTTKVLSATNGAFYSPETIHVKGVVKGQVTLAAATNKDIIVIDDLTYAYFGPMADGATYRNKVSSVDLNDPAFTDKVGLIAGRDILVQPPKIASGSNWGALGTDVYLQASICAVSGSFGTGTYVESGSTRYYKDATPQKTLHTLGGIAQQTRGAVGTLSGTGFYKDYRYDTRFTNAPPPHFPTIMYTPVVWRMDP